MGSGLALRQRIRLAGGQEEIEAFLANPGVLARGARRVWYAEARAEAVEGTAHITNQVVAQPYGIEEKAVGRMAKNRRIRVGARTVLANLTKMGVLVSDTPLGAVRLALPDSVVERWLPALYPAKA